MPWLLRRFPQGTICAKCRRWCNSGWPKSWAANEPWKCEDFLKSSDDWSTGISCLPNFSSFAVTSSCCRLGRGQSDRCKLIEGVFSRQGQLNLDVPWPILWKGISTKNLKLGMRCLKSRFTILWKFMGVVTCWVHLPACVPTGITSKVCEAASEDRQTLGNRVTCQNRKAESGKGVEQGRWGETKCRNYFSFKVGIRTSWKLIADVVEYAACKNDFQLLNSV